LTFSGKYGKEAENAKGEFIPSDLLCRDLAISPIS
jgi:hypothetical protein